MNYEITNNKIQKIVHDVIFIESIRLITHNESEGILFLL